MSKETLSPHELNQFAYCPHQWYYEKIYGKTALRRLRKEHLATLGLSGQSEKSNFVRGLQFHEENYRKLRQRAVIWKICMVVLLLVLLLGIYLVMRHVVV